MFVLWNNY